MHTRQGLFSNTGVLPPGMARSTWGHQGGLGFCLSR